MSDVSKLVDVIFLIKKLGGTPSFAGTFYYLSFHWKHIKGVKPTHTKDYDSGTVKFTIYRDSNRVIMTLHSRTDHEVKISLLDFFEFPLKPTKEEVFLFRLSAGRDWLVPVGGW